ncbi:YidH family protein [Nocardioides sp. DS6]|uniref:YidH family protein n=1 Tax=Nocardioides eburneus TaxID=3231482 RepID=A0ABV3T001_9ACTN
MDQRPSDRSPHRHPHWVYDVGDEPDPRFSLANERTFLAWARTALAVLAGAVALHSLDVPATGWLRTTVVVILVVLAIVCTVMSILRWARVERAMRLRQRLPAFTAGFVLAGSLVVVGALLGIALLLD